MAHVAGPSHTHHPPESPGQETALNDSIQVVAAIFGADDQAITEYLVKVPAGMDDDTLVDQVIALARVEGVVTVAHGRLTVAIRAADADDHLQREAERPTIH
jgi:hypothetical protein